MSTLQHVWQLVQRNALLGSVRAPLSADFLSTTFNIAPPSDQADETILLALGLLDLYRQIGHQLPTPDVPNAPPPMTGKALSNAAAPPYLVAMLDGRYRELMPEMLTTLRDTDRTIPFELLPNLLSWGAKNSQNAHLIYQTIGARGHQLARLRPEWHYATDDIYEWEHARHIWQNGRPAKRQAFLRQLRHLNPTFARTLLASSWKAEPLQQRLWFIRLLAINLSLDDEPFLEMVLDDRMLTVRLEAIKLLTMLPASKLCQRMQRATRSVLTWHEKEARIMVRFPVGINRLLQRDGVPVQANPKNVACLRGEQLRAIVLATPLETWTTRFGVSAETIIKSLPASKWPRTLLASLSEAALRQHNETWAYAILRYEIKPKNATLFGLLSAEQKTDLIRRLHTTLTEPIVQKGDPMQQLLYHNNHAWTDAVSTIWLERIQRHFEYATQDNTSTVHNDLRNPLFMRTIRKMAQFAPIELSDIIITTLYPFSDNPIWRSKLQAIIALLRFRQKLHALLTPNNPNYPIH